MPDDEVESGAGTVGELLKRSRQAKGVELDEASQVTKIGKNYLAAIEEGDFDKLPNPAYLKGFLRLYANYLGLSGDEVISRYQKSLPPSHPNAEHAHHEATTMAVEHVKFRGHHRWAVPLLLLCLVGVAALFFTENEGKKEKVPAPAPPPAAVPAPAPVQALRSSAAHPVAKEAPQAAPAAAPAPAQPPAASAPGAPGAANAPAAPAASAPAVPATAAAPKESRKGVILKLRFNQDSWLSITIDGAISQRYDLKAGDIIEWKGARGFTLDLGDGGAVEGEFNGKPLKPLGERGKPAHVELKAE